MQIGQLIENLSVDDRINEALNLLEDIIVDTPDELLDRLAALISSPQKIADTHRFASFLSDFMSERYIVPLVEEISKSVVGETPWLADYMYALGNLLEEREEYYVPEESFVHLLGDWLLNTDGGEISWKAGIILVQLEHPACVSYYRQGVISRELFVLTRVDCLAGVVKTCGAEELELYRELLEDPEQEVREAAEGAIEWLNKKVQEE